MYEYKMEKQAISITFKHKDGFATIVIDGSICIDLRTCSPHPYINFRMQGLAGCYYFDNESQAKEVLLAVNKCLGLKT